MRLRKPIPLRSDPNGDRPDLTNYFRNGWTSRTQEADPPGRFGLQHLVELAGSMHTSRKMVRESEETAP